MDNQEKLCSVPPRSLRRVIDAVAVPGKRWRWHHVRNGRLLASPIMASLFRS